MSLLAVVEKAGTATRINGWDRVVDKAKSRLQVPSQIPAPSFPGLDDAFPGSASRPAETGYASEHVKARDVEVIHFNLQRPRYVSTKDRLIRGCELPTHQVHDPRHKGLDLAEQQP